MYEDEGRLRECPALRCLLAHYDQVSGGDLIACCRHESLLVRWLNTAGIRTKRGSGWTWGAIHDLLHNTAYVGKQHYGKAEWRLIQEGDK